jgi:hypothetical protein
VLKFDIATFFDRYLLERLHRSLQQTDLLGIGRFAALHVRSLLARDAFLLLADLAARQVLERRGRDVDGIDGVGIGCARADDCRDCKSNVYAHSPPQYGGFEATFCTVQLAVQVGASAALPCELRWRCQQALREVGRVEGERFEIDVVRKDGRKIKAEISMTGVRRRGGNVYNLLLRDISAKMST